MKCNNCDNESPSFFSNEKCYYLKVPLSVVKCDTCELVYLAPRPDKSKGLEYFENAYSHAKGYEKIAYYSDDLLIFSRSRVRFESILKLNAPNKKILDFGAGQGHFVKVAQENNWEVEGIEISDSGRENAKTKFDINLLNQLDKLNITDFGVIALWDVIEHLEDPKAILLELKKFLHPQGIIVIETSNIDSLDYLTLKKRWSFWHVDHLFYYARKSLNYLMKTLDFEPISSNLSEDLYKSKPKQKFKKYLRLLSNPIQIILGLKRKYLGMRNKNLEKNSLMTGFYRQVK